MICDATQPVALGGIMGGLNSEVNSETKNILLESAYFLPSSIKKTSGATGLTTEASQRFEKGVDINGVIPALNRAASLIAQLCGGTIARGIIDQYPSPLPLPEPIQLSVPMVNRIIGSNLKATDMHHILKRLHIRVDDLGNSILSVTAPTFRVDVREPIDLVEEIARLNGYENIPATYPQGRLCTSGKSTSQLLSSRAREILISRGFSEVINYSFIDPTALGQINLSEGDERSHPLRIVNPLSEAQSVLRTTLIPSLLCNLTENLRHKNTRVNIFEISSIFLPDTASQLPREQRHISGLAYGARFVDSWDLPRSDVDFFDIKGCIEILLEQCRIADVKFLHTQHEPFLHPQHCLTITADNSIIGYLGEVHPAILARFDIDKSAYLFDLDFDKMTRLFDDIKINFKPFPRYPSIFRDLALVIDDAVAAETVRNAIISFKNKLIDDITLFDYFKGKSVPQGKKSLAYRVKFQSPNRSLTDEEVNKIQDKLIAHLSQEVGAELRH
jgi:phenylalanyl-tRNA synthetase beta chain